MAVWSAADPAAATRLNPYRMGVDMLWTILLILVALWALGLLTSVGGAFIHLLLVLAIVVFVAQLLTGRRSTY